MAYSATTVYRVLIASPSDVQDERLRIPEAIYLWNNTNSAHYGVVLLPVKWETHSMPSMSGRPQGILNEQLVKNCDILIGAFWTRLGTHTGKAESGSVEEIEEFMKQGKQAMLYFSSQPVVPDSLDPVEYARLRDFKDKCKNLGLFSQYDSVENLLDQIQRHLTQWIQTYHKQMPQTTDRQDIAIKNTINELLFTVKQLEAEWASERDSQPHGIDNGKYLLQQLGSTLTSASISLEEVIEEELRRTVAGIARDCKTVQQHRVYLDGGVSYREFWSLGDRLVEQAKLTIQQIKDNS